ncbi:hypothetical protein TELCIR_08438 [Teladorsagia circumcincta]|uniref:Uncharacterized protein n=1 Tax=Teladorsagia circumcincta TaxID=45464 RepID=A0A2G9UJ25_TELCI|nr:hypothetical protein TELCIR_08438 [Teladorsagia circumcincta]
MTRALRASDLASYTPHDFCPLVDVQAARLAPPASSSSLLSEVELLLDDLIEESVDSCVIQEQKAALQYGRELQLQIEQLEQAPRPPFESIVHLRQRIERENELYRRQFVWQMENSEFNLHSSNLPFLIYSGRLTSVIRFTTNA